MRIMLNQKMADKSDEVEDTNNVDVNLIVQLGPSPNPKHKPKLTLKLPSTPTTTTHPPPTQTFGALHSNVGSSFCAKELGQGLPKLNT